MLLHPCVCLLYGSCLTLARPLASDCSLAFHRGGATRVRHHNLLHPLRGLASLQGHGAAVVFQIGDTSASSVSWRVAL